MRHGSTYPFVLALVAVGCAGGSPAAPALDPTPARASAGAPRYDAAPELFEADVVQLHEAGRYTYVELSSRGHRVWLATVGPPLVEVGDHAAVVVLGRAASFRSRRLSRTFADLRFGAAARFDEPKEMPWMPAMF